MSVGSFAWSARERREADLFLADLLGHRPRPQPDFGEQAQVCGFFRADNTVLTPAQLRAAIVRRCRLESNRWRASGGRPKPECDVTVFGRLIGYYLAANPNILPDSLTSLQANAEALAVADYGPVLGPAAPTSAQVRAVRTLLLAAGAPGTTANAIIDDAIAHAREGHDSVGTFRSWSAVFVSACVRGAAIAEGIEAVTLPGRTHAGQNLPLSVSVRHADYVIRARADTAAGRRGRYHAFVPSARAPQLADIIVQDRRDNITASQVRTLAALQRGAETHGDIVVRVGTQSVETIGGNVADGVRRRRYPLDPGGLLVTDVPRLYGQESDTGGLATAAALGTSCQALADKSTARIFALLSLVDECRNVPSGGSSGSGAG